MSNETTVFAWRGREMRTIGDVADALGQIETREEAQEFMVGYREACEHADANIGYMSGYYGPQEMRRIQDWFGVAHPVFGRVAPSAEESFAAGQRLAGGAS